MVTGLLIFGLAALLFFIAFKILRSDKFSSESDVEEHQGDRKPEAEKPAESEGNRIFKIAADLETFFDQSSYPADLLEHGQFKKGVEILMSDEYNTSQILDYYSGVNVLVGCMAGEALYQRNDDIDVLSIVLDNLNEGSYWKRYFSLRLLDKRIDEPLIGTILSKVDYSWEDQVPLRVLREFIQRRVDRGEALEFGSSLNNVESEKIKVLEDLLPKLGPVLSKPLVDQFQEWENVRVDVNFLGMIGQVWDEAVLEDPDAPLIEYDALAELVDQLEKSLLSESPRSLILVGDAGVGKTAAAKILAKRLHKAGWVIFDAGATELMAGQSYIGQLEMRIQKLVEKIGGNRQVLWVLPRIHELMWAGTHRHSPTGALDMVFPFVDSGQIKVVGETNSQAYERMLQALPRIRTGFKTVRLTSQNSQEALDIARSWINARAGNSASPITEDTLREAYYLTQQYLADKAAPGNIIQLLDATWQRLSADSRVELQSLEIDDVLVTLSQFTGLPMSILDSRQGLDLEDLGSFFNRKVMGQAEAVDCLVERVAMIKAGVTDPTRPAGVFLFAGPTGTGKTEIAKTLAEYLFGSPERMIRLDMSEFQTPESLNRILGDTGKQSSADALVNLIRKQPFSVVLLDEFEKAAPNIWDVFLQVFDDGRLTDRMGNIADFRHAIIILTSNLGAAIPRGAGIGFGTEGGSFQSSAVGKAIEKTFRKEFINRLDRLVIFKPLSRSIMRDVLLKELQAVMKRRGLRNRTWAVEWDESAIEFLLQKGFTMDLGARPLKRAIERYVLSPLAKTIVSHQFPEGDQFLYIRSAGDELEVEFIDPEAPEPEMSAEATSDAEGQTVSGLSVKQIVLDGRGTPDEVELLVNQYRMIEKRIVGDDWSIAKSVAMTQMSQPEFWESPDRFRVLGQVEYMDRIEAGFATASRLQRRLAGDRGPRDHYSSTLTQRFAHQIYLLECACENLDSEHPQDVFLMVEAARDSAVSASENDDHARKIFLMYRQWAKKRRMKYEILEQLDGNESNPYRVLCAFSGYAALSILRTESGIHVFEVPENKKSFRRYKVYVRTTPQPWTPASTNNDGLLEQARIEMQASHNSAKKIVRRYREMPSPLVRDSVSNWRTGRADRVLAGDFDLME